MEPGSVAGSGSFKQHELAEGSANLSEEARSTLNALSKLRFAKNLLLPALISLLNVRKGEFSMASRLQRGSEVLPSQRHRHCPGPRRVACCRSHCTQGGLLAAPEAAGRDRRLQQLCSAGQKPGRVRRRLWGGSGLGWAGLGEPCAGHWKSIWPRHSPLCWELRESPSALVSEPSPLAVLPNSVFCQGRSSAAEGDGQ